MRCFLLATLCIAAAHAAPLSLKLFPGASPSEISPQVLAHKHHDNLCFHTVDTEDHKCFEACASSTKFVTKGIDATGTCPTVYNTKDTTKTVLQCPDGVTNTRYCAETALNVTIVTKGVSAMTQAVSMWPFSSSCESVTDEAKCDNSAACTWCKSAAVKSKCYNKDDAKKLPPGVFACDSAAESQGQCAALGDKCAGEGQGDCCATLGCQATAPGSALRTCIQMHVTPPVVSIFMATDPAPAYVHMIETSPGDHCLEVAFPGGKDSGFWKSEGWKYSAPVRPEWVTGACDRVKWTSIDSKEDSYDGWDAAKSAPYGAVVMTKYGFDTGVAKVSMWPFSSSCESVTDEAKCGNSAACTWCKSAAVKSKCYNKDDAKKLPPGVFACDSAAAPVVKAVTAEWPWEKCFHKVSANKCYQACSDDATFVGFEVKGLTNHGECPKQYTSVDSKSTEDVCNNGESIKYCKDDDKKIIKVEFETKGEVGVEVSMWPFSSSCESVTDEAKCDNSAACTWCKSAAVKSKCYSKDDAKKLPPGVFACGN